MGIRIAKVSGERPGLRTMFLRHAVGGLLCGITFGITGLISALMVRLNRDKRALHDFLAGTYVTHDPPPTRYPPPEPPGESRPPQTKYPRNGSE